MLHGENGAFLHVDKLEDQAGATVLAMDRPDAFVVQSAMDTVTNEIMRHLTTRFFPAGRQAGASRDDVGVIKLHDFFLLTKDAFESQQYRWIRPFLHCSWLSGTLNVCRPRRASPRRA